MSIAEEIDGFLKDYECEGEQAEWFVNLLKRASKELKNLERDGNVLIQEIANKNHNAFLLRKQISDLEKKLQGVKHGKN